MINNYCKWTWNSEDFDYYDTECGERFCLDNDEGLEENKIKYCPFCGKKIKVVKEK